MFIHRKLTIDNSDLVSYWSKTEKRAELQATSPQIRRATEFIHQVHTTIVTHHVYSVHTPHAFNISNGVVYDLIIYKLVSDREREHVVIYSSMLVFKTDNFWTIEIIAILCSFYQCHSMVLT